MTENRETQIRPENEIKQARLKNQDIIERKIIDGEYSHLASPSQKLVEIQADVFAGIDLGKPLGIRQTDVRAGEYLAPAVQDIPKLLAACNQRTTELITSEIFSTDYDYAVRAAALTYSLYIMCHPLRDGNGQSCLNLISSYLKEANWKKSFLPDYKKGSKLKVHALGLLQTEETPTENVPDLPTTADLPESDKSSVNTTGEKPFSAKDREKQKIAGDLISQATGILWPHFKEYLLTGKTKLSLEGLSSTHRGNFKSLVERIEGVNQQLKKSLSSN